ncbi:MAG: flagellar motor protein MotB [Spirochaetales bacterium]|nr:MAG: flagellar motor protein MotB [Spirochaetales bacterium]
MAGPNGRRKKRQQEGAADWLLTYGDMVTLLLTFFVLMFTTATIDGYQLRLILAAFPGLGNYSGGNTLEAGPLAELGNTIMSLPSMERGRALSEARREAVSLFEPEVRSNLVRIGPDERGLVISLASDAFFASGSAAVNIDQTREILQKLSRFLRSDAVADRRFRIEGHTDNEATDPNGAYPTNWDLASARASAVLHYLKDFEVNEAQFQLMSRGEFAPIVDNETPEGRAYNRRVDIIILTEGTL